jgi:hypothetical protein
MVLILDKLIMAILFASLANKSTGDDERFLRILYWAASILNFVLFIVKSTEFYLK